MWLSHGAACLGFSMLQSGLSFMAHSLVLGLKACPQTPMKLPEEKVGSALRLTGISEDFLRSNLGAQSNS